MILLVISMAFGFLVKIPSAIRHDRHFFPKIYKVDKRPFLKRWIL